MSDVQAPRLPIPQFLTPHEPDRWPGDDLAYEMSSDLADLDIADLYLTGGRYESAQDIIVAIEEQGLTPDEAKRVLNTVLMDVESRREDAELLVSCFEMHEDRINKAMEHFASPKPAA